jgi:hypothetical protein
MWLSWPAEPGFQGRDGFTKARLALLQAVARAAYEQSDAIYIVGGFVRDLLLDRPSLDFDLVVEGDAISLARTLVKQYGGRITSHSRFGTAKWFIADIADNLVNDLRSDDSNIEQNLSHRGLTRVYRFDLRAHRVLHILQLYLPFSAAASNWIFIAETLLLTPSRSG